jgi:hypothetical protein
MKNKKINDIIVFMINNNLDYKNYDLLSNLNVFINKDYTSNKALMNLVKIFENNLEYSNFHTIDNSSTLDPLDVLRAVRERFDVNRLVEENEDDESFDDEDYREEDDEDDEDEEYSF